MIRKHLSIALFVLLLATASLAKEKKQYVTGRIIDVRTQEVTSAEVKKPGQIDEAVALHVGGPKRVKYMRYSIILGTDAEMLYLNVDREAINEQPEFKNDMEIKVRDADKDHVELLDSKGKKYAAEILRRVEKNAPTLRAPKPAN